VKFEIFLLSLLMCIVLASFVVAEDGTTEVNITNSAPTILTVELNDASTGDDSMNLTAATTTVIYCNGTATDADGDSDIALVQSELWSNASNYGAVDNPTNHYTNASCAYASGVFSCEYYVQFYADPAEWACNVTAIDSYSDNGSLSDNATMQALVALDIPDATHIDFGDLAIGENTSDGSFNITFENEGNVELDIELDAWETNGIQTSSNSMNCTVGNIGITYFRASLSQGLFNTYTSMSASGPDYTLFESNLTRQTTGVTPTNDTIFLGLEIPTGVGGHCTGVVSVVGLQST
jgi:hypothetical protein